MKTDIEIAQECKMEAITNVAEKIGLSFEDIELYGKYKAKIPLESLKSLRIMLRENLSWLHPLTQLLLVKENQR